MLYGIDISNWQADFNLKKVKPAFAIFKATEGIGFKDKCLDKFAKTAIDNSIPFGFYHFARENDAKKEAQYFYEQTKDYKGQGIPVLDFEVPNKNTWLTTWCKEYYNLAHVYPWVYMSSDYVNNKKYGDTWVKSNCALWIAGYPKPYKRYPKNADCPYKHNGWNLAAWQFTSSLQLGGMSIDGDVFYGDIKTWNKYASKKSSENEKLTVEKILQLATECIKGKHGTSNARKKALGANYAAVQAKINDLYDKADKVIKGQYGNGNARKKALGSEYTIVQYIVNKNLK